MLAEILTFWLMSGQPLVPDEAVFHPLKREVSNWRLQAAGALDLLPLETAGLVLRIDPKGLSRCVRLNNYWCIKRAGWAGEIAADAEGHVAFSSSQEGALVAAVLLKRYYVDFKRRSARDIVSRWAPAQCGGVAVARTGPKLAARVGPKLVVPGLGGTLRARWLARGRGGAPLKRSVVADRPIAKLRAPSIAVGMGERDTVLPLLNLVNIPLLSPGVPASPGPPVSSCGGDTARIANYARKASAGIAAENADLKLFDGSGMPTPNLNALMMNMASVEIGPLRVRQELVDAAVAALVERLKAAQVAAEPHS